MLDAHLVEYDEWLYRYCGSLAATPNATRYEQYLGDLLSFGHVDPRGAAVLDAGCGFGFMLLALRWLGAAEARGVDVSKPMIDTVRAYLPLLPDDFSERIHVEQASVADMPHPDESVDLLLSVEAISHYRDVEGFIREARRVLRKGGCLLIRDGNNGLNPRTRRDTRALWNEFETGEESSLGQFHERDGCYRLRREEILRESFPELNENEVSMLVLQTSYMDRDQIIRAVSEYRSAGKAPASFYDGKRAPVDPDSGAVIERLFDPYRLAAQLRASGFSTRVAGYWGGAGGKTLIRLANEALVKSSRVTIYSARAFTVAARKT